MYSTKQPRGKVTLPMLMVIVIIILAIAVIPLVILIVPSLPGAGAEGAEIIQIPQKQNNQQDIKVSLNSTTLYVPDTATNLTGNFVISPLLPNSYSYASEADWYRPIVADIVYRNSDGVPYHGITFSQPVSICFKLTQDQWADFKQRPNDFQVQYFDDAEAPFRWVSLPMTMDPELYELCTETDHLSIYALAVKNVVEEVPITGATLTRTPTPVPTDTPTPVINTPEDRPKRNEDDGPAIVPQPPTKPPPTKPLPTKQPTQPPATDPPATDPPATEPPATEPPATEPPATEPPATEDPATDEPPATEEPITEEPPISSLVELQ